MTPFDRSKDVLERISVRRVLEESNLPIEIATAIADALEAPRPEAALISVPRSLAERTEAMFRSVDPEGAIAQEWGRVLSPQPRVAHSMSEYRRVKELGGDILPPDAAQSSSQESE